MKAGRSQRRFPDAFQHDYKEGSPMILFFSAFIGGLLGTGLMDIAEVLLKRLRLTSGAG